MTRRFVHRSGVDATRLVVAGLLACVSPVLAGGLSTPFSSLPWAPLGTQVDGLFGFDAAPAGDIDGDGYGDVIVGAPFEQGTFVREGAAYLFRGSPQGSLPGHSWVWRSGQFDAFAGFTVSSAGDVNGDGYSDVLVGVQGWDTQTHANAGKVAVFHGGANGLPLTPTYERFAPLPAAEQAFGRAVAPAGDVNGDGYDDVLVSANTHGTQLPADRGAVYVFHGGPAGLAATPTTTWVGLPESGQFGRSISSAGDVNADGYFDVIIGAPSVNSNAGAAYLFLGSSAGGNPIPDTTVAGTAGSQCGSSVSLAGDANGDGYADVLIGSPGFNGSSGKAELSLGGAGGLASSVALGNPQPGPNESFGRRLATVGDIDADGYADFAVFASDATSGSHGRVSVFRGDRTQVLYVGEILSPVADGTFGNSIGTAGDANGDGFAEILIGTEDMDAPGVGNGGRAFQYRPPRQVPHLLAGWPRVGAQPGSRYGSALAHLPRFDSGDFLAIGDPGFDGFGRVSFHRAGSVYPGLTFAEHHSIAASINAQGLGTRLVDVGDMARDGYSDLVVSSPTLDNDPFFQAGRVDFHRGALVDPPAPSPVLVGTHDFDRVGSALAGRGDVNGDGYHDLLVGAREWDSGGIADRGKAWLLLGSPAGPTAATWTYEGALADAGVGTSVALGDLDADGYSDVIVGSVTPSGFTGSIALAAAETPGVPNGKVEVIYGGPGGPPPTPGLVLHPQEPNPSFGSAVAAIGDVTGDGICDLAVGSPRQSGVGRVDVYRGTLGRSQSSIPLWSRVGTQADGRLGAALSGGGDVDGDGIGDFVIGEPGANGGQPSEGRFHLHYGARPVPEATSWSTEADFTGAEMGASFAVLRDFNLDGFADILVGAPGAAGRVYAFFGGSGPGARQSVVLLEPFSGVTQRFHPARVTSTSHVGAAMVLRSAAGRTKTSFDFEVVPQNQAFSGVPTFKGPLVYDSGAPGAQPSVFPNIPVSVPGVAVHLRARVRTGSPFFPRTKWFTPEGHVSGDHDSWLSGSSVAVEPGIASAGVPRLNAASPNPAAGGTPARFDFALPRAAHASLEVFDVRGARVRVLVDEELPAGAATRAWDGRDEHGRAVPAGLYFVRFAAEGRADRTRLVLLP
jgi:hypothetical protein